MAEALQEQVEWKQRTGYDSSGEPVFAAAVPVYCRWSENVQQIRSRGGEQIVSMSEVWLRPNLGVAIDDVLIRDGQEHVVLMAARKTDLGSAPAYLKVYV